MTYINRTYTNWRQKFNLQSNQLYNDLAKTNWESANVGEYKTVDEAVKDWGISGTYTDDSGNAVPLDYDLVSLETNPNTDEGGYNVIGYRYDTTNTSQIIRYDQTGVSYVDTDFNPTGESYTWADIEAEQQADATRQAQLVTLKQTAFYNDASDTYNVQGAVDAGFINDQDAANIFGADWNAAQTTPQTAANTQSGGVWDETVLQGYADISQGKAVKQSFYDNLFDGVITDEEVNYGLQQLNNPDTYDEFVSFIQQQGQTAQSVKYLKTLAPDLTDGEVNEFFDKLNWTSDNTLSMTARVQPQVQQEPITEFAGIAIQDLQSMAESDPDKLVGIIKQSGKTDEAVRLLKSLSWNMTDDEINSFFNTKFDSMQNQVIDYLKRKVEEGNTPTLAEQLQGEFAGAEIQSLDSWKAERSDWFEELAPIDQLGIMAKDAGTWLTDNLLTGGQDWDKGGAENAIINIGSMVIQGGFLRWIGTGTMTILKFIPSAIFKKFAPELFNKIATNTTVEGANRIIAKILDVVVGKESESLSPSARLMKSAWEKSGNNFDAFIKSINEDNLFQQILADERGAIGKEGGEQISKEAAEQVAKEVTPAVDKIASKPIIPAQEAKQPWQMTREELIREGSNLDTDEIQKARPIPSDRIFYHVVPSEYKIGDPIKSGKELSNFVNKWEEDYLTSKDYGRVSLFDNIAQAEEFNYNYFDGKGKILKVKINENNTFKRSTEGYRTVKGITPQEIVGETSHRQLVQQAISEGKPVPESVLKDYPELKIPETGTGVPPTIKLNTQRDLTGIFHEEKSPVAKLNANPDGTLRVNEHGAVHVTLKDGTMGYVKESEARQLIKDNPNLTPKVETPPVAEANLSPELPSGRKPGGIQNLKETLPVDNLQRAVDALTPDEVPLKETIVTLKDKILTRMYDTIEPFKQLEKDTGIPAWSLAKLTKGSAAAGEDILRVEVLPVLKPVAKDLESLKVYMTLMRDLDIVGRNTQAKLPGGVTGGAGVYKALEQLKGQIGTARYNAIESVAKKLYALNDKWKLQVLQDAGVLSKTQRTAIKSANPHYVPFYRSDFTGDVVRDLSSPGSASVSSTGIKTMGLEGSERKLDDPLVNWLGQFVQVQETVSRNTAAKGIISALQTMEKKTGQTLITKIEGSAEHSLVTDTISYFDNGVKVTLQIPKIYATAAKSLDNEAANVFTKAMSIMNAPLRYGAVTYNPGFIPVNMTRDATTAFFREKLLPFSPSYFKGWTAAVTRNKTFQEVVRGGGLMSGIIDSMRSTDAIKVAARPGVFQINNIGDVFMVIPRMIEKANLVAEQATRLATYIKLKGAGVPELEALVRTRDVTVDFAQMGTWMKVINNIIPFTNASLQGTVNIGITAIKNPKWALVASTPFIMATVLSRTNNMRYETSKDIPYYEYTNYWVIQFGEYTSEDGTKAPLYFKLPKGQLGALLTFPGEALFSYVGNTNNRSAVDILLEAGRSALESASPVPTDVAGLLPSAASTAVELATGENIYTGMPIIPRSEENLLPEQQYGTTTSKIAIALGDAFNISPRLLDFALKDYTAGTGQAALWLTDLAIGAAGYNPEVYGSDLDYPLTTPEKLAQTPVVNRFIGVKSNQESREGWDNFDKMSTVTNREFSSPEFDELGIRLGEVGTTINNVELTPQERAEYQRIMADIVIPGMQEAYEKYAELSPQELKTKLEAVMSTLKTKARGIYVAQSGNEKFISSWNEYIKQLGMPQYDADSDKPEAEIYNTTDLRSDILDFMPGITAEDLKKRITIPGQGVLAVENTAPEIVQAIVRARDINTSLSNTVNKKLYQIDEDSIEQYYTDGKLNQSQYILLQQYNELSTDAEKKTFREENLELNSNPFQQYMVDNPEDNAYSSLFYGTKLYTLAAYNKYQAMIKTLGIPGNSLPDVGVPQDTETARAYFDYQDMADQYGTSSAKAKLVLMENPKLAKFMNTDTSEWNLNVLKIQADDKFIADDTAYDNATTKQKATFFDTHENYEKQLAMIDGYELGLDEKTVKGQWTEFSLLPEDGYWRERYQANDLNFVAAVQEAQNLKGIKLWDNPRPLEEIPAEGYDKLSQQYQQQIDLYDNLKDTSGDSEEVKAQKAADLTALLSTEVSDGVTFQDVLYRREAYKQLIPEEQVDSFVGWSQANVNDKKDTNGNPLDYSGYIYLKDNLELYNTLRAKNIITKDIDFRAVPTKDVNDLFQIYRTIKTDAGKKNFLKVYSELGDWLNLRTAYTKYNLSDTLAPQYVEWAKLNGTKGYSDERYLLANLGLYTELVKQGVISAFPAAIVPSEQVEFYYDVYTNTPWASSKAKKSYLNSKPDLQKWMQIVADYQKYLKAQALIDKYSTVKE